MHRQTAHDVGEGGHAGIDAAAVYLRQIAQGDQGLDALLDGFGDGANRLAEGHGGGQHVGCDIPDYPLHMHRQAAHDVGEGGHAGIDAAAIYLRQIAQGDQRAHTMLDGFRDGAYRLAEGHGGGQHVGCKVGSHALHMYRQAAHDVGECRHALIDPVSVHQRQIAQGDQRLHAIDHNIDNRAGGFAKGLGGGQAIGGDGVGGEADVIDQIADEVSKGRHFGVQAVQAHVPTGKGHKCGQRRLYGPYDGLDGAGEFLDAGGGDVLGDSGDGVDEPADGGEDALGDALGDGFADFLGGDGGGGVDAEGGAGGGEGVTDNLDGGGGEGAGSGADAADDAVDDAAADAAPVDGEGGDDGGDQAGDQGQGLVTQAVEPGHDRTDQVRDDRTDLAFEFVEFGDDSGGQAGGAAGCLRFELVEFGDDRSGQAGGAAGCLRFELVEFGDDRSGQAGGAAGCLRFELVEFGDDHSS